MALKERQNLLSQITGLINELPVEDSTIPKPLPSTNSKIELLTVKEAAREVAGLSECTVRQLVAQGKLSHIRSGAGKRGKILIPKSALLAYFRGNAA